MRENIKYFGKLSITFLSSIIKLYAIGVVSTVIIFVAGILLLAKSIDGAGGHSGPFLFIIATISSKPISATLFYIVIGVSPFIISSFSLKYAISRVIYKLISDKQQTILEPIFDKIIAAYKKKQPTIMQNSGDFAIAKLGLLNELKNTSENKIIKKLIGYTLKKIKLSNLDFKNGNLDFYNFIKVNFFEKLKELAKPDIKIFSIYIVLQWITLVLIYIIKL